jgi:predicted DNA-binding protein YlxM (UPF0122 family)
MPSQKGGVAKQDLKGFKEEIVHQFHVISEGVIDQVKQVAEGVANVDEKLDRRFNELRAEIQETRQEVKEFLELKHRVEKIETRSIS